MITRAVVALITFVFLIMQAIGAPPAEKPLPQSAAATDSPAPGTPEYRLGPGDVVKISVQNNPEMGVQTELSNEGKIRLPRVGEMAVGGLTQAGAAKAIADRLRTDGNAVNLLLIQDRGQQAK
jgi:polysaccharide export outer membrane protein